MQTATIVVLTHALQGKAEGYFIAAVARHWSEAGHRVLFHQGLAPPPDGDLAVLHIDSTRLPPEYLALAARFPRTLNAGARDIGKRRVSRNLVQAGDDWAGPVIVKTDANAGGRPDRALRDAENRQRGRWRRRLGDRLARPLRRHLPGGDYAIFESRAAVPAWIWRRDDLVVERFLPERRGENYVLNSAFLCGSHGIVSSFAAADPLVKIAGLRELLPLDAVVPDEVRAAQRMHALDFGKIDYVVHSGVAQVLDVNPTPHLGLVWDKTERLARILRTLAGGLEEFLPASAICSAG